MKEVRVRFAPSPTGLLHVGSFRTALFNWLFARKTGGKFILRIEDTDRVRSKPEYLQSQLADLEWMGLNWDEGPGVGGDYGPYFQMERLSIYKEYAKKLMDEGKAYFCYCTAEELERERQEAKKEKKNFGYSGRCRHLSQAEREKFEKEGRRPCIRFMTPQEGVTVVKDLIKGEVSFENQLMDDFVIVKSDGIPTYNFAVVIDDYLMKITHVIRGDEHMSNAPKQIMIYDALGFEKPQFCHIPIILNKDRSKLSKRKGAVHLLDYKERGYLREALLNFLALLGWAPKDNREIFSKEELIEAFSLEGISKHPAIFDEEKLEWLNSKYIQSIPDEELIPLVKEFLEKMGINPNVKDVEWYKKAIPLYRERAKTLVEFAEKMVYYFKPVNSYDPKGVKRYFKKNLFLIDALKEMAKRIEKDEEYTPESLEKILREYAEEIGVKAGKLIHAVRLACTGTTATPPLFDVVSLIDKNEVINRLLKASDFIKNTYASS